VSEHIMDFDHYIMIYISVSYCLSICHLYICTTYMVNKRIAITVKLSAI